MKFLYRSEVIDYDFYNKNFSDTILFLHGFGGDKNSFNNIKKFLINKYNILSITIPTNKKTNLIFDLNMYSNLVEEILKILNIKNPIIICHSFGLRILTLLNTKINIKKIVITGGAGIKNTKIFRKIQKNNQILLYLKGKNKNFSKNLGNSEYENLDKINKISFKNIINFDLKYLMKFACPTLLFWGKKDLDTPIFMAKIIKKLSHGKLVISSSNHFAYLFDQENFIHNTLEFIDDHC